MSSRNSGTQSNRSRGYYNNRPTGSAAMSSNIVSKDKQSRSEDGDPAKAIQSTASASPKRDSGSDSPGSDSNGSVAQHAAGQAAGSAARPDSSSSAMTGRKAAGDTSDLNDSLPHASDVNGAPIVASAASSHSGGSAGHYNRNNNWNAGGSYGRNNRNSARSWAPRPGGSSGYHNMHNSRPSHMAPISAGYAGPAGGRRFVPGLPAGMSPFPMYGYPAPGPLQMVAVAGPDGSPAGLLPTPAAVPPYQPFSPACPCNSCVSQYYFYAAAAAQSLYGMPPAGMSAGMFPNLQMASSAPAGESFASFQQQQQPAAGQVLDNSNSAGPQSSGMSPRSKATAGQPVMYMQQQPQPQKQKPSESKAGLAPIPLNKQQPSRGQEQQQPMYQMYQTHSPMTQSEVDQQQQAMGQGQQPQLRYTYFPNIVNPPLVPAGLHDLSPAPLYHDVMNGQSSGPTYISSYPRYQ